MNVMCEWVYSLLFLSSHRSFKLVGMCVIVHVLVLLAFGLSFEANWWQSVGEMDHSLPSFSARLFPHQHYDVFPIVVTASIVYE